MKHLLTLTALLISSLAMGQMPYNPDSNGDDLIGATDLISVLGLYNTLMIDSSLTCSYEGTELEQLIGGLFDGTFTLDSVYVEYLLVDTVYTYLPGCPDPYPVETVLNRSYTITTSYYNSLPEYIWSGSMTYLGYSRSFYLSFNEESGEYRWNVDDNEVAALTTFDDDTWWNSLAPFCCSSFASLPFLPNWTIDENGFQVDLYGFANESESFRCIPFWSQAE